MAITLSVAAGINSESHRNYRKILESCLEMISYSVEKDSQRRIELCFYEFYILVRSSQCMIYLFIKQTSFICNQCELGETKRLWELFRQFQSNEQFSGNPKFFEGLAALASSTNQAFLRQILPPVECRIRQLGKEDKQREQKLQMKLTEISIQCLKISNRIHTSSVQLFPIAQLALNWRR